MEKKIETYKIWFDQVNQSMLEIKATNLDNAIKRACRIWRKEIGTPCYTYIEKDGRDVYTI